MNAVTTKMKKIVLVADDDPATAELVRRALDEEFEVRVARNGREALALARVQPLPSVIVLDVMMPGIDGLGVATALRSDPATKHPPIIFLSAKDGAMDVIQGIQRGARYYMTKPFKIQELRDKVRRAAQG
jgi:DNA-binding response OmpR family regulator